MTEEQFARINTDDGLKALALKESDAWDALCAVRYEDRYRFVKQDLVNAARARWIEAWDAMEAALRS